MIRSFFVLVLPLCLATATHAQLIHLSPVSSTSRAREDTLLRIERRNRPATGQDAIDKATDVRIHDGKFYFLIPNEPVVDDLGNRTLFEFVQYLNGKYPGHSFSTRAPEVRASDLKEGTYSFTSTRVIYIKRGEERPQVAATLGLGFIANEVRSAAGSDGSTLMRNAGIDLEVVATKQVRFLTSRARIGFHSAEPVPVQDGDTTGRETPSPPSSPATSTSADPRATISGAQAVGVGLELSYHFPLNAALDPNQSHVALVVEGSQYWASPSAYDLPSTVRVNGETKAIGDVFSEEEIQGARDRLERIVPLSTGLVGARFLFGRHNDPVFYLLGDVGVRQYLIRSAGSRYTVTAPPGTAPIPNPSRIGTIFEREWEPVFRAGGGVRLSRAIDVKVDVVAPLRDRKFAQSAQPTLRIQLATYGVQFGN